MSSTVLSTGATRATGFKAMPQNVRFPRKSMSEAAARFSNISTSIWGIYSDYVIYEYILLEKTETNY
jgi:hypothetical protein